VRVELSLREREWSPKGETKYFNSLDLWTLSRVGEAGRQRDAFPDDERRPRSYPSADHSALLPVILVYSAQ
jgi:hypothetical protein